MIEEREIETAMEYEVELKFRRRASDGLEERIRALDVDSAPPIEQRDAYFVHPVRDFRQTDEAFRIRSEGAHNRLTYKGPRLDRQTKTRQELEIEFSSGATSREEMVTMLLALGFRESRTVVKRRRTCRLEWENREVQLAFDLVEGLGEFVELEMMACESDWPAARDSLQRLAAHLGLSDAERRSYLELLVAEQGGG